MFKYTATLILAALLSSCGRSGNNAHPVRKDLTQAVYASGKLFPAGHYTVFSKFAGYVEKIHVRPGESVKAGQVLISIRNEINPLNIDNARNQLQLAQDNADENGAMMSALKADLAAARAKYELDSINYQRSQALQKQDAVTRQSFDQSKTQFEISRQNFQRSSENLRNTREKLRVELMNARNQLEAQTSNQKDYDILSVINGKVYDVTPQTGDLVTPQIALLDLGDSTRFEVDLSVDETDISFLKPGQQIAYSIDAFRNKVFHGTVTEIYPKVNPLSKTSRIKASFDTESMNGFYSGMSVEANIIITEKKNVLVVPKEFVKNGNQVQVKGEDKIRIIETGAEDLQFVEILKGLDENSELVKF